MTLKILFITNFDKAGIYSIRPEAEMMLGVKRAGLDVEVMTPRRCHYGDVLTAAGIRVHDFKPRSKFSWEAVRTIRAVLREGRHDVVQMFNNPAIVNGVLASIGLPVKAVTYRGQTGNIARWDPVCYFTHLSPRVDRIVCVAEAVRRNLLPVVYDRRKPVTIHKGHDLAWYAGTKPADLAKLGVPADAFTIACVSNYRPRKGVDVLIEAAKALPPDSRVHFLLIGRGMDGPELAKLIAESPLRANFHSFGHRTDVLEIVAACQATVLASTKREGLPKTVIESMVHGVAPIVTDTGGSAELVEEGVSGLVVPAGDVAAMGRALVAISADAAAAKRMGEAARERIGRSFRVSDSVAAHVRLFEDICAAR